MENLNLLMKEHHLKVTPQRVAILNAIDYFGHITIDSLYNEIKNQFSSISLATIYKNINSMKDKHIIQEIKLPNEKSVYEVTKEKHSHFICNSCSEVIDIDVDISNKLDSVSKKYDFIIEKSNLVLSGICKNC